MTKQMRYLRVKLHGGKSNPHFFDWLTNIQENFSAPTIDFASDNVRVVKTSLNSQNFIEFRSTAADGTDFSAHVEVIEITRRNAREPELAACTALIQRYYKDFTDIDLGV